MLDDLKELLAKTPFEPFSIITASGDKYKVRNPWNIALMESRIFYAFPHAKRWVFIRTNQITALESASKAA